MKKIFYGLLVIAFVLSLVGCSTPAATPAATEAPVATKVAVATEAGAATEAAAKTKNALKDTYELAFVIPGTNSQYWNQYAGTGVNNAVKDLEAKYGVKINVTLSGPTEEGQTDQYLNILESVIAKKPDIIITATMQPDGTAPLIKEAKNQGIYVNLFSLGITGEEDSYGALYYCDQPQQGELAAKELVRQMDEKGIEKKGYVAMELATSVPVLEAKMQKFKDTMKELAPEITVLDTLYNENDVQKAQANAENQISTYGDKLIGFFGGNNLSGDGIVLAVKNAGIKDHMTSVAVDSDDSEISGLKDGNLGAIIVQTPYAQAYQATTDAFEAIVNNYVPEKNVNAPAEVVTLANMTETHFAELLNPLLLAK